MARTFLILNAVIWIGYGLYCFFVPGMLGEAAGVVAASATGSTELRAMYGGAQIGIGLMCVMGLLRPALQQGTLIALLCIVGGLGTTRLLGAVIDSGFSGYTGMGLGLEFFIVGACIVLLRSAESTASPA